MNLYEFVKGKVPTDDFEEALNLLTYVQDTAQEMEKALNMEDFYNEHGYQLTKRQVNAILRKIDKSRKKDKSKAKEILDFFTATTNLKFKAFDDKIKELERKIEENQNKLIEDTEEYCSLKLLRVNTNAPSKEELDSLTDTLEQYNLKVTSAKEGLVTIITPNITLNHTTSLGNNITVPMGHFKILLDLNNLKVDIQGHKDNIVFEGSMHPHVSTSGIPCWGNASSHIIEALKKGCVSDILSVLMALLYNYNAASPYKPLENFYEVYSGMS